MPFLTTDRGRLEYQLFDNGPIAAHTIVMLHEGLGSVSLWKDFPERLAAATRSCVIAYSRFGYGKSTPMTEPRTVRYMHDEALIILPQVLDALEVEKPILFGHSDGASIALIFAGGSDREISGVTALAPHVFVEELSVTNIAAAKTAYQSTNLRERLARHHDDVDRVFWGWNDIWLSKDFRAWNIEEYLPRIRCPILAIQGRDDEYGTMEQIRRIERQATRVETVSLAQCRHSLHRDQPERVLDAVGHWVATLSE
jgi:pimeloyl-ACP methyl ester carboxylesterase